MLDKQLKFSKAQYNAAVYAHRVVGKLLLQAGPSDETPLSISLGEVLQVAGEELMSGEVMRLFRPENPSS